MAIAAANFLGEGNMKDRIVKALNRLMGQWAVNEQDQQRQEAWASQHPLMGTTTTTTTTASTAGYSAPNTLTTSYSGLFNMGGGLGSSGVTPLTRYTNWASTPPKYEWSITHEQLDRFMAFMEAVMQKSWTCMTCERQYAPLTPDCEFCNVIARLEASEK